MSIADRYRLTIPNQFDGDDKTRVADPRSHDENMRVIEEKFNELPIDPSYLVMRGVDLFTEVPHNTLTDLDLPTTAFFNVGFETSTTEILCDVPGWYDFSGHVRFENNGVQGSRLWRLDVANNTDEYADFELTSMSIDYNIGNWSGYPANCLIPVAPKPGFKTRVKIVALQNSGSAQDVSIRWVSMLWVRPLLDTTTRSTDLRT